jgi:hypothetical protein
MSDLEKRIAEALERARAPGLEEYNRNEWYADAARELLPEAAKELELLRKDERAATVAISVLEDELKVAREALERSEVSRAQMSGDCCMHGACFDAGSIRRAEVARDAMRIA